jgi:hypothetical protein
MSRKEELIQLAKDKVSWYRNEKGDEGILSGSLFCPFYNFSEYSLAQIAAGRSPVDSASSHVQSGTKGNGEKVRLVFDLVAFAFQRDKHPCVVDESSDDSKSE